MTTKLLIATNNPSKLIWLSAFFSDLPVKCVSPAQLGLAFDAPENGKSAVENAIQKAVSWQRAAQLPTFAEDSGLVFLDLPPDHPDQPHLLVRRANGGFANDEEMLRYYQALVHRHGGALRAVWQSAWCLCASGEKYEAYADDYDSLVKHAFLLTDEPCEVCHPGWPLDSLSKDLKTGRYFAEESVDDKAEDIERADDRRNAMRAWLHQAAHKLLSV